MLLDGSEQTDENLRQMLFWDVMNGVTRRSWAGNRNARQTIQRALAENQSFLVTMANDLSEECLKKLN